MTLLAFGFATPFAHAAVPTDLSAQKLFGQWNPNVPPVDYRAGMWGYGHALSPKWAVVGTPGSDDRGVTDEGVIQVHDAVTGKWMRKISPPVGTGTNAQFGYSVAIQGDLVVVGARYVSEGRGRVFVYNLATGALVRTFNATDGAPSDALGFRVAISGNLVIASAVLQHNRGAVYVFNLATGLQVAKLTAGDGFSGDYYGYGLAVEGHMLAVGTPFHDDDRGAVYLYDLTTMALFKKHQPAASTANDGVGTSIAMHQGKLVMGCRMNGEAYLYDIAKDLDYQLPVGGTGIRFGGAVAIQGQWVAVGDYADNGDVGAVHLFSANNGTYLRSLYPPNNGNLPVKFGANLAMCDGTLMVTAPYDMTQAIDAGTTYLIRPLTSALPYTVVAAKGDFAPGVPNSGNNADISYNVIGDTFINNGGKVLFSSSLTGAGSNNGKDMGVFTNVAAIDVLQYLYKTRDVFSGVAKYGATSRLSMNDSNLAIGLSTLTGTGVNASNNQMLWFKTESGFGSLIRTGTPFATTTLTGTIPASIVEAVTSDDSNEKQMAAMCTLKVGTGGTTAVNDTALYFSRVGTSDEALREGSDAPLPLPATACHR